MNDVQFVPLDSLTTAGVETRACLRPNVVDDYSNLVIEQGDLPPGLVFDDGQRLWLAAGHHRRAAYRKAGRKEMPCVVRQGTRWDAIKAGIQDNIHYVGERLSREDRAHNVRLVLKEEPGMSDSAIARLVGVSDKTVAAARRDMEATSEIPKLDTRTGSDGRTRDVTAIGRKATGSAPSVSPTDTTEFCSCGGLWTSDGNGGRYCDQCNRDHAAGRGRPDTPGAPGPGSSPAWDRRLNPQRPTASQTSARMDTGLQPGPACTVRSGKPGQRPLVDEFDGVERQLGMLKKSVDALAQHAPGPDYRRTMDFLDKAAAALKTWRQESVDW